MFKMMKKNFDLSLSSFHVCVCGGGGGGGGSGWRRADGGEQLPRPGYPHPMEGKLPRPKVFRPPPFPM